MKTKVEEHIIKHIQVAETLLLEVLASKDSIINSDNAVKTDKVQTVVNRLFEYCQTNLPSLDEEVLPRHKKDSIIVNLCLAQLQCGRLNEDYFDEYLEANEESKTAKNEDKNSEGTVFYNLVNLFGTLNRALASI